MSGMRGQIPMTNNAAGRKVARLEKALAETFERMWLWHCHRRDLALFVNVEPDFEKWCAAVKAREVTSG